MKKIGRIVMALVVAGACGAGGYFAYHAWQGMREAEVACVATVFPYFLIAHNQDSIVNALHDLEDRKDGQNPPPTTHPTFLSKNIEERFTNLADGLREDSGDGESEGEHHSKINLPQEFRDLVALFRKEAPGYLNECVNLFEGIFKKCGHGENADEQSQTCMQSHQDEIQKLVDRYTHTSL